MEPDTRRELEAAVGARRELGREHEDELIDGFLERLDKRLVQQGAQREKALKRRRDYQKEMILGAMGVSIPLLVIAGIFGGVAGIALVCAALAVIAVVVSRSS
jgi:VIT1/CCC1 family predicted Fe2+/Mn2+ transporter